MTMKIGAGVNVQTTKSETAGAKKHTGEIKQSEKKEDNSLAALLEDIESSITAEKADTSRSIRG